MAIYSLAKACEGCIKSKKRCDRSFPSCQRCVSGDRLCTYQNVPLTNRIPSSTKSKNIQVSATDLSINRLTPLRNRMQSSLSLLRQPEPDFTCEIDLPVVVYMVDKLRQYPVMTIEHGGNPFIHPRLYQTFRKPYFLASLDNICEENIEGLKQAEAIQPDLLRPAIQSLLDSECSLVSFLDCLSFVQALVTIQILSLLVPTLSPEEHQAAHQRQKLLVHWSEKLWAMAPAELPSHLSSCDAYMFAESVRRTLIVAYELQAVYCVMQTGSFLHTPFGSALPFDANVHLWERNCVNEGCLHSHRNMDLLSYREYVDRFEGDKRREVTLFEKMLVVGCQGVASVEPGVVRPFKSRLRS